MAAGAWGHDRHDLVAYFASAGADVGPDHVVQRAARPGEPHRVLRLMSEHPDIDGARLLAALPAGEPVECCVPAPSPFAAWLQAHGFEVVDADLFCATPGVHLVPQLLALHRGLL